MRPDLVRAPDDRLDVLDLARLEEDVRDRNEERPLVDPLDDLPVVLAHDDLEVGLRLVQVADGREVAALVDHAVPTGIERPEAGERDRLRDGDVLVHDGRPRRGADDASDLVAHRPRRRPPALRPRPDPALGPHARELVQALGRTARHRPERVAHEVRRGLEDRELVAVLPELAHVARVID